MSAVTMQEAEAVREVICSQNREWVTFCGDRQPSIEDGESWGYDWIVCWEEGPHEWTITFPRELIPEGIGISPINHVVLGLYRERAR